MKAFKLIAGPACSIQSRDCKDNVLEVKTRPRSNFLNYYHYPFESAPSSVIPLFLPPPNVRGQKSLREQELSQKTFWRRVKAISGFCIPLSRDYNRVLVPLDKNWWDDQLESLCKCTCIYEKFNPHIFVNFSAWHCVTSHSWSFFLKFGADFNIHILDWRSGRQVITIYRMRIVTQ